MAIKMDGHTITALQLKASDGSEVTKQLTEEGVIPTPTESLSITANGTYDVTTKASAVVAVPAPEINLQTKTATTNGVVLPDEGYDALSKVTVNVPTPVLPTLTNPALASDILSGKEALDGDGAKLVGTCTFDADTKDATATASDIAKDKTAYVNGQKVVGTNEGGEAIYYCAGSGLPYMANMELTYTDNQYFIPSNVFNNAPRLTSLIYHGIRGNSASLGTALVSWCGNLKRVSFPDYVGSSKTVKMIQNSEKLEEVTLGKIGTAVTKIASNFYTPSTGPQAANPTVTIYVDAETLADVPTTDLAANAPFGFGENSVIVYRSSTTGEVLT